MPLYSVETEVLMSNLVVIKTSLEKIQTPLAPLKITINIKICKQNLSVALLLLKLRDPLPNL